LQPRGTLPPPRALAELGRGLSLNAQPDQEAVLRAVRALRRELATAGRSRRGRRTSQVDLRSTMRASLQTGGVPATLVTKRVRPRRPQLIVLCDVSTSVSSSAVFFLSVVTGLHDAFSQLRTYAFIERADEVTELCERSTDVRELGRRISADANVVDRSGYTDYGRVFQQLALDLEEVITRRHTLLVLGDARTNGRDPGTLAFASLAARAGRTLWLNPEPELYWNYGDSQASELGKFCEMHQCATPADLQGLARLLTVHH